MMDVFERLGWFTDKSATPTFDPGPETSCPVCEQPVGTGSVRSHSFLLIGGDTCYFYRTHIACATNHPEQVDAFEHRALDEAERRERMQ